MIEVSARVSAPVGKVWQLWTDPKHIVNWAYASDDWEARKALNEVRVDGWFMTEMAAKDGSESFEFGGVYTHVDPEKRLDYTMDDGRKVEIEFLVDGEGTTVIERFDPEQENPDELQRSGWQAILNNFKNYAEAKA